MDDLGRVFVVQHPLGMVADLREEHLRQALAYLTNASSAERKQVLKSVDKALEKAHQLILSGYASRQVLQDASADVGIWFANQVRRGRVDLDTGKYIDSTVSAEDLAKFREWHSTVRLEDTDELMKIQRNLRRN